MDNTTIKSNKLLLVEGADDFHFFQELLKYLNIDDYDKKILPVDGKDNFNTKVPTLTKLRGFDDLETLLIIRDADEDANNAFQSIYNIIKDKANLVPPYSPNTISNGIPKIGIYILPDNYSPGSIEDLCLKLVEKLEAMNCVNTFIECTNKLDDPPRKTSKAKVQAFLATKNDIAYALGRAAEKGYWDFDSTYLNDLKSFLENLR
jgi:hypothetical protein